jgi:perosamine synthetase
MKPAILGGPKSVTLEGKDAVKWPLLAQEEEEAVLEVLRHGDLSCHPVTRDLERDYCEYFRRSYALAHCNGTAALMAAFFALDLQPGDEVIVPSATFWASVVPMLWFGAVPIFCESEPERMGLDPEDVERKVTSRTRAIVIVHLWGMPSKMTELFDIAQRHNLKIIEDASHAHGASWRDRKCGTLGDISVFSLQTSKLAPAGEGGIFLTDDYLLYEKAICLGDMVRILELKTPAQRFAGTTFGIKTRMAPLSAAIARVQLRKLERHNLIRNRNTEFLSKKFLELRLDPFLPPPHIERVYYEFLVRYDEERIGLPRELFVEALRAEGCDVSLPRYPLLHQQPLFREKLNRIPEALPQTEAANNHLVRFPVFTSQCEDLLEQYAAAVEKVIHCSAEIEAGSISAAKL